MKKSPLEIQQMQKQCFLIPNGTRVVVQEDDFHYSGRLVIPDKSKRRPTTGYVVAALDKQVYDEWVGRRVVFAQFSGTLICFKNQPAYRVLDVMEILAEIITGETLEERDSYELETGA